MPRFLSQTVLIRKLCSGVLSIFFFSIPVNMWFQGCQGLVSGLSPNAKQKLLCKNVFEKICQSKITASHTQHKAGNAKLVFWSTVLKIQFKYWVDPWFTFALRLFSCPASIWQTCSFLWAMEDISNITAEMYRAFNFKIVLFPGPMAWDTWITTRTSCIT